jgi:hypothetical protein
MQDNPVDSVTEADKAIGTASTERPPHLDHNPRSRMRYRTLGRTGIKVSPYALGTLMFATAIGNPDHDDSIRIIHKALDVGINFIDTADAYGDSEEVVGKALRGRRDGVVLATKVSRPMGDDPNQQGTSRRWIMTAVENSLRRLQTDHIDLYQIQRPDPTTDIEETLSALSDLIHSGRSVRSDHPRLPPQTSSKHSGSPSGVAWNGSAPSSRPTRSLTAASSLRCCRSRSATAWAYWCGVRSGRDCSPAVSGRVSKRTSAALASSRRSATSVALTPSNSSSHSPKRRACR